MGGVKGIAGMFKRKAASSPPLVAPGGAPLFGAMPMGGPSGVMGGAPSIGAGGIFSKAALGLGSAFMGGMRGGKTKVGRFSGSQIPRGTKEKISKTGAVILTETHRAKGLTGRDLRGFRRTVGLLRSVGMHPKRLHRAATKKGRAA